MIRRSPLRRSTKPIARRVRPRARRQTERAGLERTCDKLWSQAVRKRDGHRCVCCNGIGTDAHHIFGKKAHPEMRYVLANGLTLCREHHDGAHMHPKYFRTFVQWYVLSEEAWLALCGQLHGRQPDLTATKRALEAA